MSRDSNLGVLVGIGLLAHAFGDHSKRDADRARNEARQAEAEARTAAAQARTAGHLLQRERNLKNLEAEQVGLPLPYPEAVRGSRGGRRDAAAQDENQADIRNNAGLMEAIGQQLITAQNLPAGSPDRQVAVDNALRLAGNLSRNGQGEIVEPIAGRAQSATLTIGVDGQSFRYTSNKSDNFRDAARLVEDMAADAARHLGGTPISFNELGLDSPAPAGAPARRGPFTAHSHALGQRQQAPQTTSGATVPEGNPQTLGPAGGVNPQVEFNRYIIDSAKFAKAGGQQEKPQHSLPTNAAGLVALPEGRYSTGQLDKDNNPIVVVIRQGVTVLPDNVHQFVQTELAKAGVTKEGPAATVPPAAPIKQKTAAEVDQGQQPRAQNAVYRQEAEPAPSQRVSTNSPAPAPAAPPAAAPAPKVDEVTITAAGDTPAKLYPGTKGKIWNPSDAPKIAANQVEEIQQMLGVKVDGKWGPDTQKAFAKKCSEAGITDTRTVDFTNPRDPELIALMGKLDATKVARVDVAPTVATPTSPRTQASVPAAPAPAPETAAVPPPTVVTPAPAPAPAVAAAPAAQEAAPSPQLTPAQFAQGVMEGKLQIPPGTDTAQMAAVFSALSGAMPQGEERAAIEALVARLNTPAQPAPAPVEPAPAVVAPPAPVMQQTAFTPAPAANEPNFFAMSSFADAPAASSPAFDRHPPAVQTSLQAARDAGVTQQFAVFDAAEAQSRAGGAKRANEAGLSA
jgi:hypothetical protein